MKFYRLPALIMIVLLCLTTGLVFAQNATPEPTPEATLPPSMATALVPCAAGVTGPCDLIATKPRDIVGVWKQYLEGPPFNALGEMVYIRFNADGTWNTADTIENTMQPFTNYPTGTFKFVGQQYTTPTTLSDNVLLGPCSGENVAYQVRVLKDGDQPVALRFVVINDACLGRVQDWTQALVRVAPNP